LIDLLHDIILHTVHLLVIDIW